MSSIQRNAAIAAMCAALAIVVPDAAARTPKVCLSRTGAIIGAVAASPDGSLIAADSSVCLWVWDAGSGKNLFTVHYERSGAYSPTRLLAFSRDSKLIAVGPNDAVLILDSRTGQERRLIEPARDGVTEVQPIEGVAFSPDGRQIAVALHGPQQDKGLVAVYGLQGGAVEEVFRSQARVNWPRPRSVSYSPDGRRIAVGGLPGYVEVIDAATGALVFSVEDFSNTVNAVAFSPDGSQLLAVEYHGQPRVYDTATGKLVAVLRQQCPGPGRDTFSGYERYAAFLDGGSRVAAACGTGVIEICQSSTGECRVLVEPGATEIMAAADHPGGRHMLMAELSASGISVVVRDMESGSETSRYRVR